jgi:signal transduction histidine kinase
MKTKDLLEKFEKDYREEKKKEAEELHNAVAQVLADHRAEVQTVLYVLEMLRFEILKEKYEQLFNRKDEPKPGEVRFGKPE